MTFSKLTTSNTVGLPRNSTRNAKLVFFPMRLHWIEDYDICPLIGLLSSISLFSIFMLSFCCCCCVASVLSNSVRPNRRQPTRLPRPWDSPSKNTGVRCHFLLQCMKVKSEREVAQSCPTLSDPMDCSLPGSSIHGIFQAKVLECGAIAFSGFLSIVQLFLQLVFYFLILSLGLNTKSLDKACGCILLYTNNSIFTEMVDGRKPLLQDKLMGLF